jgi:hypothetical protein
LDYPLDRYPDFAKQKIIGTLLPVEKIVAGKKDHIPNPAEIVGLGFLRVDAFRILNIEE